MRGDLFLGGHGVGTRPRGFAADVDEIGSARLHLDRRRLGGARIEIQPAVGK